MLGQRELEKQKMIQEKGRKQQTREMVADSIRRNEESALANLNLDTDEGRPDDTDDPDDEDGEGGQSDDQDQQAHHHHRHHHPRHLPLHTCHTYVE